MNLKRVPTGIPGFDELVQGGLVKNSTVLVSGGTGTGKTIFSLQYLYNGITKFNEPGVFLSFEESPTDLIRDVANFKWDLQKLIKEKKLSILYEEPTDVSEFTKRLEDEILKIKAKRLVVDSTSVFGLSLETPHEVRMRIFDLIRLLSKLDVTTLLTAEIVGEDEKGLSRFGVEEFVVDGVITLHYLAVGTTTHRTLLVRKMRATHHSEDIHPIEFGKAGLVVKPSEAAFEV